jgi:multiple sugar transport system substrate-binding protein
MPDVFQAGNTWIPEFVALGALEALDGRIRRSATMRRDDYFPGILDTNVVDGATYGVPWYVDTRLIFYRSDLLQAVGYDQPPATWARWLDAMTRLKERGGAGRYAMLLPLNEWQMPVILALQADAPLLRDGDRYGNFGSHGFHKALDFYVDLFRRDLAPRAGAGQVANLYQDFAAGFFAVYVSGPWNIGEFAARLPAALADKWATTPMPGRDPSRPGVSIAGGASLAVVHGAPRADAAWKLVEYLSETAQQVAFYRLTGDLPAQQSAWKDDALAHNRYAAAFRTQLQFVRATPKIPEWERIADKISQYAEAAVRDETTTEAAADALDADVDALLEKRRWMLARREAH